MCLWRTTQTLTPVKKRTFRRRQRGFSLIELLIAFMIMLTLASIAIPSFLRALERARTAHCVGDLRKIADDINLAGLTTGTYPTTLIQVDDDTRLDPWGDPYLYVNLMEPSTASQARLDRFNVKVNQQFDLYSMGPDKLTAQPLVSAPSQDDIIWASDGGYIGTASQF
jgi:general secretion pathway protein G